MIGAVIGDTLVRLARVVEPDMGEVWAKLEPRGRHEFQGMGRRFAPPNLDRSILDGVIKAREEDGFPLARRLARGEGLFLGMSSGAAAGSTSASSGSGRSRTPWAAPRP